MFTFEKNDGIEGSSNKRYEQAGAEQCQAQEKIGLARNCGNFPLIKKLKLSSICLNLEVVFCFQKIEVVFHLP